MEEAALERNIPLNSVPEGNVKAPVVTTNEVTERDLHHPFVLFGSAEYTK